MLEVSVILMTRHTMTEQQILSKPLIILLMLTKRRDMNLEVELDGLEGLPQMILGIGAILNLLILEKFLMNIFTLIHA